VDYRIWLETGTVQDQYEYWASTKEAPLFGTNPDAKIMDTARSLGSPPHSHRILDVGAGTGRNTLPLARAGYPTDALEITEAFCKTIKEAAKAENLPVKVIPGNVLDPDVRVDNKKYSLVVCTEVTSHFRGKAGLRTLFERASRWLRDDGLFLVNGFVATDGYEPDAFAREMSQIVWSTVFTRDELQEVCDGLPFALVSDEQVYAYEKEHQPPEGWPPTGWFEDWSRGYDCYGVKEGLPPMELRWLLYRKLKAR
jgi:cyclopropane fatty-acyl-phospholipid synthase-like methyltransferase